MAIPALVFAVIMAAFLGGYWFFVARLEANDERALRQRVRGARPRTAAAAAVVKAPETLSAFSPLAALLRRQDRVVGGLRRAIHASGMNVTVGTVVLASLFLGLCAFAAAWQLTSRLWIGAIAASLVAWLPIAYLQYRGRKRMALFEEQFPEAIDLMARALRAGHALTTALQMVADELPDPAGAEFRQLFDEQNYGRSLPDALRAFGARVQLLDARFFATAVLTQRETGGNLSEVFDNLASVIRERFRVKRQVRVISAHGRITGVVLGLLPIAVAAVLMVISPTHIRLLVDDPFGLDMLGIGVTLQIIGVLAIRRIVNVEY
jgi:tight adherence protein B